MMKQSTKRSILRWIHIVLAIPIAGYVYSPFENIPEYAGPTRYVFFPVLVLTGLWMWKGQAIGRLFSRRSPEVVAE
jgi:thiosulfate reductase cytochrome b subunit